MDTIKQSLHFVVPLSLDEMEIINGGGPKPWYAALAIWVYDNWDDLKKGYEAGVSGNPHP
jgi:hypothetical protein